MYTALRCECLTHACRYRLGIQSDFLALQRQFYSTGDIERSGIPSFFRSTGFPGYLERTRDFAEKIEKEKRKREKEKKKNNRPVSFLSTPRTNSRFAKGKKKRKKERRGKKEIIKKKRKREMIIPSLSR